MRWVIACGLVCLLTGCASDEDGAATTRLAEECKPLIDECLQNQMTCGVGASGAECRACPDGEYAGKDGLCRAIEGELLVHDFPETTTPAGGEIRTICRSWTLHNETELWVHAVELQQNESSHHSNWMFAPEDRFPGPDGLWPCAERDYDQLTAALAGGVLYAQSTQARKEVQRFPDGVAIRIPPYSTVISSVHTLNTTEQPVTGHIRLSIYLLPADDVRVKLAPFHLSYDTLDIPPQSTARFSGTCELESEYAKAGEAGFGGEIYWILPHTHALGSRFFLELAGGSRDGETLIDVRGFNEEARGRTYDPPIDVAGATGLRFGCEFENPRAENVIWGFGDQEMCECLGFFASPLGFESRISEVNVDGAEGAIQKFTGPCTTIAFPWDQHREGGTPGG